MPAAAGLAIVSAVRRRAAGWLLRLFVALLPPVFYLAVANDVILGTAAVIIEMVVFAGIRLALRPSPRRRPSTGPRLGPQTARPLDVDQAAGSSAAPGPRGFTRQPARSTARDAAAVGSGGMTGEGRGPYPGSPQQVGPGGAVRLPASPAEMIR